MLPLLLVLAAASLFRLLGTAGIGPWGSWRRAVVPAVSLMFVVTGAAHFTPMKEDLARLVPPNLPAPRLLVALSGAIQIGGGLALLAPRARTAAACVLIALLL